MTGVVITDDQAGHHPPRTPWSRARPWSRKIVRVRVRVRCAGVLARIEIRSAGFRCGAGVPVLGLTGLA